MNKNISKSRTLRRRLLSTMIICLITVMVICTLIFNIVYKQTAEAVADNTSKLTEETFDTTSDIYYQQLVSSLQMELSHLCNAQYMLQALYENEFEYFGPYDVNADWREDESVEKNIRFFLNNQAAAELSGNDPRFFFTFDGVDFQTYNLDFSDESNHDMDEVFAAFDSDNTVKTPSSYEKKRYDSGYYEDQPDISDYMYEHFTEERGAYTRNGNGYIIVWTNTSTVAYYNHCFGVVMYDVNDWIVPVRKNVDEKNSRLLDYMNGLFKKYIFIMISLILGVLLVFIIVLVVLSKKLSDPIVSEHDMLVKVNEMKTTFLSDASHELKTPLAAMSGYAQNAEMELVNGGDISLVQEKLKRITSEANRMALMVTQILDVTRIEEGRMLLDLAPCDLDKLVRETIETYFAVLNKNNNKLALRIPLELPEVKADSSRLQRVFVNLISNALKHTKNGTILVKAEAEGSFIKATVKDTGSGISEEDMPHIWERYYKGKHSETGTGLGLFICKFIIESHGGRIWAESQAGKGTAFMFTLPIQ
ncbi:sensor histidine kinase [Ruminococcus flavefaciens]|uniref:histidine kinase n=1 Tax=Ruminococcus flavefaciens 007c TaxID=1341157 RepID=W7UUD7_RUMFL|nr:HAMP domain-containing sensor histidine kinase [Ruminococcus flavefaciens]EWM54774.1 hypothetical protein RF007C_10575 [Ruminococcus flavefaciens 007c]